MYSNKRDDFVSLMLSLDEKKAAKLDAAMLIIAEAIASTNDNLMACIAGLDDGRHVNEWTYKDGSRALKKMDKVFNDMDEPWGTERFLIQMLAAAVREKRIDITFWDKNDEYIDFTKVPDEENFPYTAENYYFRGDGGGRLSMAIMRKAGGEK